MVRGSSRHYTYFRFRQDRTLEVVVPEGRRVDPESMLRSRAGWITRQIDQMSSTQRILEEGAVMYGGQYLKIVYADGVGDDLAPNPAAGEVVVRTDDKRRTRELIRRWFLQATSAYVVRKVAECAPLAGVRPSRVDVREIGKWGYCTRGGRLSFSWQLIALSERLREYVVFHELTHLAVFDHSARFRRRLASVCPDFRQRERELDRILPYDRMSPLD